MSDPTPRDEARERNQNWLAHAERVQESGARQAFEEIPSLVGYIRTLVSEAAAPRADPDATRELMDIRAASTGAAVVKQEVEGVVRMLVSLTTRLDQMRWRAEGAAARAPVREPT